MNPVTRPLRAFVLLCLGSWLASAAPAPAATGDADALNANITGSPSFVYAIASQPDGKIIIGGAFATVQGVARSNIARLNNDGTLDSSFDPKTNARVDCVAVQPDGKILLGGQFTTLQPNGAASATTRNRIARLNADGTLDTAFDPRANNEVYTLAVQPDGNILLGGNFTTLQPNGAASATTRNYIARVNADGTLDTGFNPRAGSSVYTLALQGDGAVVLGGAFTTLQPNGAASATTRNRIARVLSTGALDTTFNPNAGGIVYCTALEPDGQILLGGQFTTLQPNGAASATTRNYIARINADGSLDTIFDPRAGMDVYGFSVQADGKVILAGQFTNLRPNGAASPTSRNRIARVNADGTLDTTFNPNSNTSVTALMLQHNGSVLAGGGFSTIGGATRDDLARLANDAPGATLAQADRNQVDWTRAGSTPEVTQVTFDLSTDGGSTWTPLGNASRVGTSPDWRLTGLSLPIVGQLRARGRVTGGFYQSSSGIVEQISAYAPDIAVTGNGQDIANGSLFPSLENHTDFGPAVAGSGFADRTFTFYNHGPTPLAFFGGIVVSGAHASDFTVISSHPAQIGGGVTSGLPATIRFAPGGTGIRSATLTLANNDPDENPFTFNIQGTGFPPDNADLSGFSIFPGALTPVFVPGTTAYTATLPSGDSEFTVTPSSASPFSTIEARVDGGGFITVASGAASAPLPIDTGSNTVEIRVTAQDGTTTKTYTITVTRPVPVPGDAGGLKTPDSFTYFLDYVACAVPQPDGKIVIGGRFQTVRGAARSNLARLNPDGTLDTGFTAIANGTVNCLALQDDGKILVGGSFGALTPTGTAVPVPRSGLARLNPDGTLDATFDPSPLGAVNCLALDPSGKITLGGIFTSVKPNGAAVATARNFIARIHADGTLDTGFDPKANGVVNSIVLQENSKVLLGGEFTTLQPNGAASSTPRAYVARVDSTGALDTTFDPKANGTVQCLALQGDGKVLLGGYFTSLQPNGAASATPRSRFARVNPDGSLDMAFDPKPNQRVESIAIQADGDILVGGVFTNFQPNGAVGVTTRNYVARLNADATVDADFNPNANGYLTGVLLESDGSVLLTGGFSAVAGASRNCLARLVNHPATAGFGFPNSGEALWLRGGTAPDLSTVVFETSPTGGAPWTLLSPGTRQGATANWLLDTTVNPLTPGTWLRARGRTSGGYFNGSAIAIESQPVQIVPDIHITGNGSAITHGDTTPDGADHTDFGTRIIGDPAVTRTFQVSNAGGAPLSLSAGTFSGPHAADFSFSSALTVLAPGASGTFEVSFNSASAGIRTATLSLANNDPDEAPFTFALQGTGERPSTTLSLSWQAGITNSTAQWIVSGPPMTGLTAANFSLSPTGLGGTPAIASVTPIGPLPSNTWTVTASTGTGDGTLSLTLANDDGLSHTVSNLPVAGPAITVDRTPPTAAITLSETTLQSGETALVMFTFSEPVMNFHVGDFTMPNGTLSDLESPDSTTITAIFTPDAGVLAPGNIVTLDNSAFTDLAGNSNPGTTVSANYSVETVTLTPAVTPAVADEDTLSSGGLVLTRHPSDTAGFSTHFKITGIANGTLFRNDGVTPVADGAFLTFAEANAGLRFTPAPDFNGSAGFNVQASTTGSDAGLRDGQVPVAITVSPANDPPLFVIGANRTHAAGTASPQGFADGATAISDGDPELAQALAFDVTNDNPALFTTPPAIAADGTLGYTPNGTPGTALVSVSLTDDAAAGGLALTTAAQTFTIKVLSAPEIAVGGNNADIGNGDATPDTADHTDFGAVNIADGAIARTFTISNSGETPLSLTGAPMVQITGAHAADFTVSAQPDSPVAAPGITTFSVSFDPAMVGVRTAELVIASDDADESPFIFAIRGEGTVSADSALATVSLPGVSVTPAFHPAVTSYTGSVPGTTTGITLTPSGDSHGIIEVRVNGGSWTTVPSGGGTTVPLAPGANTVELRITAQDGSSTTYTFVITRAAQAVGIDTLNANLTGTYVMATAVQPDGKILIGGNFTQVLGTPRQHLARLNADGTLDAAFNPKPSSNVYCISVQNDGKILVGGNFTTLQPNGAPATTARSRIARLHADGTLDTGFDPSASGFISCILPQPDGKILLGGSFATLKPNGAASTISRPMLARVNADGTLDNGFAPTPNSSVDSIALQPDGRIVLGGNFTTLKPNGAAVVTARQFLARINADGTLDNSFVPNPGNRVYCVALQPDGKILLGGSFTSVEPNGVPNSAYSKYIARVNADGTLDAGFDPNGNTTVTTITLQADGKVLLGGQFTTLQPGGGGAAVTHNRLARVNASGTLDASFDVQANNIVYGVAQQADGKLFAGGTFTTLQPDAGSAAVTRNFFARLTNDSATQALSQTGSGQLDWARSGAAPEVSRVWFEQSTDGGTTWTPLGEAARVGTTSNWRIAGLSLPGSGQVRARGRTAGGYLGGSTGLVETVATLTATLTDLENWRQAHFGSTANAGDGADDNDHDHDGLANLVEFAFGSNPAQPGTSGLPQPVIAGGFLTWSFTQPANTGGIVYQAEWSETLAPGDWHPIPDTGSGADHVFNMSTGGTPRLFTRLRISPP